MYDLGSTLVKRWGKFVQNVEEVCKRSPTKVVIAATKTYRCLEINLSIAPVKLQFMPWIL